MCLWQTHLQWGGIIRITQIHTRYCFKFVTVRFNVAKDREYLRLSIFDVPHFILAKTAASFSGGSGSDWMRKNLSPDIEVTIIDFSMKETIGGDTPFRHFLFKFIETISNEKTHCLLCPTILKMNIFGRNPKLPKEELLPIYTETNQR